MSLDHARAIAENQRRHRRELIEAVAAGGLAPAALASDERSTEVKVVVLAEVVPGVGKVQARRIMSGIGVASTARWGDLAPEELRRLVDALTDAGAPPASGP